MTPGNGKVMKMSNILIFLIVLYSGYSCSGPLKKLTYMHDVELNMTYPEVPLPESYRIRPNDLLYIQVNGEDKEFTEFLNISTPSGIGGGSQVDLIAYLVDEYGFITYPHLGQLHVGGRTVLEMRDSLQKAVDQYISNTSVQVRLVNRTFTVLGDVKSPGLKPMIKNQLTIFEALGASGDISDYGNRKNVKLIRENPYGKRVVELDLTDPSILQSPYYYIQPNDVLYVEPNRYRVYSVKTLPWISQVSLATSLLTTLLLIANLFK
jgi:polysaccharide biosynthesis/export protein